MTILIIVAVIIIIDRTATRFFKKNLKEINLREEQDFEVEWSLNASLSELSLKMLVLHSNKERIARLVDERLKGFISYRSVYSDLRVFKSMDLFNYSVNNYTTEEIELSALIQQYLLRMLWKKGELEFFKKLSSKSEVFRNTLFQKGNFFKEELILN